MTYKPQGLDAPPSNNVLNYGADPTATSDSTTAIQAAINALPATGGTVYFPGGTYLCGTINVGNGTSFLASTRENVRLVGVGAQNLGLGLGLAIDGTTLRWNGSAGGIFVNIAGPLSGWGIENMTIDCVGTNTAGYGLQVYSASHGYVKNVTILNANNVGLLIKTYPDTFATGIAANSWHNSVDGLSVLVAASASLNYPSGIYLDGSGTSGGGSDTTFTSFNNTMIEQNGYNGQTTFGVVLKYCDNNRFIKTEWVFAGGTSAQSATLIPTSGGVALAVDYTGGTAATGTISLNHLNAASTITYTGKNSGGRTLQYVVPSAVIASTTSITGTGFSSAMTGMMAAAVGGTGALAAGTIVTYVDATHLTYTPVGTAGTPTTLTLSPTLTGCTTPVAVTPYVGDYLVAGTNYAVYFDYSTSGSAALPADNTFVDSEFWSTAAQFANYLTPSGGNQPNRVFSNNSINVQIPNPNLANLTWGGSAMPQAPTAAPTTTAGPISLTTVQLNAGVVPSAQFLCAVTWAAPSVTTVVTLTPPGISAITLYPSTATTKGLQSCLVPAGWLLTVSAAVTNGTAIPLVI